MEIPKLRRAYPKDRIKGLPVRVLSVDGSPYGFSILQVFGLFKFTRCSWNRQMNETDPVRRLLVSLQHVF